MEVSVLGLGYVGVAAAACLAKLIRHAVVARVELTREEISSADAAVLLTDHDAFDVGEHARYVLDCRRVAVGETVETL